MQIDIIFGIIVLVFSVILHEVAHGYMANYLGDPTARLMGRLTLNPVRHIDPVGSLLLPLVLFVLKSPLLIGFAKPVPYNPYNLRGKYAEGLVAFAGPLTNIVLAVLFGLLIRIWGGVMDPALLKAFALIVYINIVLALFNLVPIPPLDGSKVLSSILEAVHGGAARGYATFRANFERLGLLSGTLLILLVVYLLQGQFFVATSSTFTFLTGASL